MPFRACCKLAVHAMSQARARADGSNNNMASREDHRKNTFVIKPGL